MDTQFYCETRTFGELYDRKEEQDAYGCSQFSSWDRKTPRGKPPNAEQPPKCHPLDLEGGRKGSGRRKQLPRERNRQYK